MSKTAQMPNINLGANIGAAAVEAASRSIFSNLTKGLRNIFSSKTNPGTQEVALEELKGCLDQVEATLLKAQKDLTNALNTPPKPIGTERADIESALRLLKPITIQFETEKKSLKLGPQYAERLGTFIVNLAERINTAILEKPSGDFVKNAPFKAAVIELLQNTYSFIVTTVKHTIDVAIKTGKFAESVLEFGSVISGNPPQESVFTGPQQEPQQHPKKPTELINESIISVNTVLGEMKQTLGKGQQNLSTVEQQKIQEAQKKLMPITQSFQEMQQQVQAEMKKNEQYFNKSMIGQMQKKVETWVQTATQTLDDKTKDMPALRAMANVVKSAGELITATIAKALYTAVDAGKVAQSLLRVGQAATTPAQKPPGTRSV